MLFLSLSLSLSPAASCPSSLRCCSQAQNCSFPSFPPAQCLPSIIHIPTLLSHCENPSVKIMLPYSYIQPQPTLSLFLPPSVELHHSYPCLIRPWSTVSEVTRFCGSEWWSREGTSESFESQIKSTFRQTNPFVVQQCESTLGWINRVKIMILSGGKQGTTKWLSSEHTSYLRFVNFDTTPHYLGL